MSRLKQRRISGTTTTGGTTGAMGSPGKRSLTEGVRRQAKAAPAPAPSAEVAAPTGGGAALPGGVREKMEGSFGTDFSDVRVHEGEQADAVGAQAYAEGSDLHFAPGKYDPHSGGGQELLGHELAHVVQQRAGRVETPQGKGDINADASLEAEADTAGARAAQGLPATVAGSASPSSGVQRAERSKEEIEKIERKIIADAKAILGSPSFAKIREGFKAKQTVEVSIAGYGIQYEPGLPASGMTNFPSGFLIGREAFTSELEVKKTVLHELYRLNMSASAGGVHGDLAAKETEDAFRFAERAAGQI